MFLHREVERGRGRTVVILCDTPSNSEPSEIYDWIKLLGKCIIFRFIKNLLSILHS